MSINFGSHFLLNYYKFYRSLSHVYKLSNRRTCLKFTTNFFVVFNKQKSMFETQTVNFVFGFLYLETQQEVIIMIAMKCFRIYVEPGRPK